MFRLYDVFIYKNCASWIVCRKNTNNSFNLGSDRKLYEHERFLIERFTDNLILTTYLSDMIGSIKKSVMDN